MSCDVNVRNRILGPLNNARQLLSDYGMRRYAVTLVRRVWSGEYAGDGEVKQVFTIALTPNPKVVDAFAGESGNWTALEYIQAHGQMIKDRYWVLSKITPQFVDACSNALGGYTPIQLKMEPPTDGKNVEPVVILVGDDGYLRECVQLQLDIDKPFEYRMLVRETDRPRVALRSIAITANGTASFIATGTFADGQTSIISSLVTWRSDASTLRVDPIGTNLTPSGSGNIIATLGEISSPPIAYP